VRSKMEASTLALGRNAKLESRQHNWSCTNSYAADSLLITPTETRTCYLPARHHLLLDHPSRIKICTDNGLADNYRIFAVRAKD
jgi:hypothetical protein